jgi:RNA polymerase sigma-70 factor (ECF subfamily)
LKLKNALMGIFIAISCNIMASCAIITVIMVGAMAKLVQQTEDDDLLQRARSQADALARLYDIYYQPIFNFCVHRLFGKEIAEDVTSSVFLEVARGISLFRGQTVNDFQSWLYAIAANQANAYIRKTYRRKKILEQAAASMADSTAPGTDNSPDFSQLYMAILKLKPRHQTIITLRFFENLQYQQIAEILNIKEATLRVSTHRIINELRNHLQKVFDGEA